MKLLQGNEDGQSDGGEGNSELRGAIANILCFVSKRDICFKGASAIGAQKFRFRPGALGRVSNSLILSLAFRTSTGTAQTNAIRGCLVFGHSSSPSTSGITSALESVGLDIKPRTALLNAGTTRSGLASGAGGDLLVGVWVRRTAGGVAAPVTSSNFNVVPSTPGSGLAVFASASAAISTRGSGRGRRGRSRGRTS